MSESKSTAWPLLFTYDGPIIGRGFFASVSFCGRLLAWPETEGMWLDGVNPGGVAVGGKTLDEANQELRNTLTQVLVAFASEANSFEAFRSAVEGFYRETDSATVAEWEEALVALKEGTLPVPSGLRRKPADWECFVKVEPKRIEDLTPSDNPVCHHDANTALAKAA
jgi:hypothetical protein